MPDADRRSDAMNYGMYLSATGALTSMHRQDVIANNLANSQTVGFKPDDVFFKARPVERLEDPAAFVSPNLTLEELTGGHFVAPTHINFTEGALQRTGNPLDQAIRGDRFFMVQDASASGPQGIRLTRDGRFTLNERGEIVLAANGMRVLSVDRAPLRVPAGASVHIDDSGRILADGAPVGALLIAAVGDASTLEKQGDTLFRFNGRAADLAAATDARLESGFVEMSAVDPIIALNSMINATKSVQANAKMIQFHDALMDQAINRFARVA